MNVKKFLSNIITSALVIVTVWAAASYTEILVKNTRPNPTYSAANIIVNIAAEGS